MAWEDVTSDPRWSALPPETQKTVADRYFQKNIAGDPKYGTLTTEQQATVKTNFYKTLPNQSKPSILDRIRKGISDLQAAPPSPGIPTSAINVDAEIAAPEVKPPTEEAIKRVPGMPEISMPKVPSNQGSLLDKAQQEFPLLKKYNIQYKYNPQPNAGYLEFWPPGEAGGQAHPRPVEFKKDSIGIEVRNPNTKPIDILGDIVSHHLKDSDPEIKKYYAQFEQSLTDKQKGILRDQYQWAKNNEGESRSFEAWYKTSGLPAMFRGYAFQQWPEEFNKNVYTPEQAKMFDGMIKYLRQPDAAPAQNLQGTPVAPGMPTAPPRGGTPATGLVGLGEGALATATGMPEIPMPTIPDIVSKGTPMPGFTDPHVAEFANKVIQPIFRAPIETAGAAALLTGGLAGLNPNTRTQDALFKFYDQTRELTAKMHPSADAPFVEQFLDGVLGMAPYLASGGAGAASILANSAAKGAEAVKQGIAPKTAMALSVKDIALSTAMLAVGSGQVLGGFGVKPLVGTTEEMVKGGAKGAGLSMGLDILDKAAEKGILSASDYKEASDKVKLINAQSLGQAAAIGGFFGLTDTLRYSKLPGEGRLRDWFSTLDSENKQRVVDTYKSLKEQGYSDSDLAKNMNDVLGLFQKAVKQKAYVLSESTKAIVPSKQTRTGQDAVNEPTPPQPINPSPTTIPAQEPRPYTFSREPISAPPPTGSTEPPMPVEAIKTAPVQPVQNEPVKSSFDVINQVRQEAEKPKTVMEKVRERTKQTPIPAPSTSAIPSTEAAAVPVQPPVASPSDRRINQGLREITQEYENRAVNGDMDALAHLRDTVWSDPISPILNKRGYEKMKPVLDQQPEHFWLDLDNFKQTNKEVTHIGGDQVLNEIGTAIRGYLGEDTISARWGGDEFVGAGQEGIKEKLDTLRNDFESAKLPISLPAGIEYPVGSGNILKEPLTVTLDGVRLSFGTGKNREEAYNANEVNKQERKQAGLRWERGEEPRLTAQSDTGRTGTGAAEGVEIPGREVAGRESDAQAEESLTPHPQKELLDLAGSLMQGRTRNDHFESFMSSRPAGWTYDSSGHFLSKVASGEITPKTDAQKRFVSSAMDGAKDYQTRAADYEKLPPVEEPVAKVEPTLEAPRSALDVITDIRTRAKQGREQPAEDFSLATEGKKEVTALDPSLKNELYELMEKTGGFLTEHDIPVLKEKYGNISVVVKDVNGNRAMFNLDDFSQLSANKAFNDRIRAVFIPSGISDLNLSPKIIHEDFMSGLNTEKLLTEGTKELPHEQEIIKDLEGITLSNKSTISMSQQSKFVEMISNNKIRGILKELGIREVNILPPYRFELSEQAHILKGKKIININADATNPSQTILHELGHAKFESLPKIEQNRLIEEAKKTKNPQMQGYKSIKAWEEIAADTMYGNESFSLTTEHSTESKPKPVQTGLDLGLKGDALRAPERENKPVSMDELPLGKATNEAKDRKQQENINLSDSPIDYSKLTKEQAGNLTPNQAAEMVGGWWFGSEGTDRTQTKEGREQLHRSWLRNIYNADSSEIPMDVLKSHAMDEPSYDAHDWFSREIWNREHPETRERGSLLNKIRDRYRQGENIQDFGEKIGGARKDTAERGFEKSTKPKQEEVEAWRKKYVAMEKLDGSGWTIGKTGDSFGISARSGQKFATKEEAEKAIPIFAVAEKHTTYQNKDGTWSIYKKVGERKRFKVVNQDFPSREDAMKYMAMNAEKILNIKTSFGEEILPVPEIATRKGIERRTTPATPEMFVETFAPRGIEFGNWNNQEERQQVMNHAYDGLLDLAETLNIPPKALMLNGDLAIAFGARGQGLSGAKAHYERDYGVINLTKMKGAGSLAHEWLHALDHYLARQDTKASSEKVKNERGDLVYKTSSTTTDLQSHGPSYKSQLRAELKDAYKTLVETMYRKGEQYVEDTKQADKFVGTAREHLQEQLNDIRTDITRDLKKQYPEWKKSKGMGPASTEQLTEFDRLANVLIEGGDLDTTFRYNKEAERPEGGSKPKGMNRSAFGRIMAGRHSNDTLDSINAIFKAVRNRSAFGKDNSGYLDRVRAAMSVYKARLKMFEDAQAGTEKTKSVPTSYAIEAKKMDQARTGDYWSEPHEMAARAFASYVEDKIAAKGGQSDFLVYHAHGGILLPMIDGFVARPYPEGNERIAISEAFDKFVNTIKTRETGKGVELYSFPAGPIMKLSRDLLNVKNSETVKRIHDAVTIDPLPTLTRISQDVANVAVQHASARIATPRIVDALLSEVFPTSYKDPAAMSNTIDILNKDNVLAGYDEFHYRASEARKANDEKLAQKWEDAATDIEKVHDLNAYNRQVQAAKNNPEIADNINRWKTIVNPVLDDLYNEVKGVDPNTARDGRGKYFDARINLLTKEKADQWDTFIKDDKAPTPSPSASNYRNPNAKHDPYDRAAKFTGDYSTDARLVLLSVLTGRYNEATKIQLYNQLQKSGAAILADDVQKMPDKIQGKDVARLPIKLPQTNNEGRTHQVEKTLYIRKDIVREVRDVLATDMPLEQNPVARALTSVQLMQIADAVTHAKNILTVITAAQGSGDVWKDVVRKVPGLGTADAVKRVLNTYQEVLADGPEIRAEMALMAEKGLLRPHYPSTGIQKITHGQQFLEKVDTAARVVMNRFFDNLVDSKLAKDTEANRRNFINQVGQYNSRLMGPTMRAFRNLGLAPFIVAGRNYNRQGRRFVTGFPGVETTGKGAEMQMRLVNLASIILLFTLPMILNTLTTGKPGGRDGTPLGAWDLGRDEDEKGKHKVIDLLQITGVRRGIRSIGVEALIEGLMAGHTANQIAGAALEQSGQAALHPWLGPAPAFASKFLTGKQLDLRGRMEAQRIPEGGGKQYLENLRAAIESQNPLIYSAVMPAFREIGLDAKPHKGYLFEVGSTLLKSPFGAFGVRDVSPSKSAAEEMTDRLLSNHFAEGKTAKQMEHGDAMQVLRQALISNNKNANELIKKAVDDGVINFVDAMRLRATAAAKLKPLTRKAMLLSYEELQQVVDVATPEELRDLEKLPEYKSLIENMMLRKPKELQSIQRKNKFFEGIEKRKAEQGQTHEIF